jgi:hypothetical protein
MIAIKAGTPRARDVSKVGREDACIDLKVVRELTNQLPAQALLPRKNLGNRGLGLRTVKVKVRIMRTSSPAAPQRPGGNADANWWNEIVEPALHPMQRASAVGRSCVVRRSGTTIRLAGQYDALTSVLAILHSTRTAAA